MKSIRYIKSTAVVMAAVVLLFSTSCTKEANDPTTSEQYQASQLSTTPITDKKEQAHIKKMLQNVPGIAIYNAESDQYLLITMNENERKFDFSSPGGGIVFSTPSGTYTFVQGPDGGYYQVVEPGSSGGGGGGGLLTAGNITLNVAYVLCFASGDEGEGLDFFGFGEEFTGFAGAIGIAGNFEDLANADMSGEDFDPFEYIFGYVVFYVFDGSPNGPYDVLDFFDAESEGEDFLEGNALAYFISFQNDEIAVFFGVDGQVIFNGNQVGFEGTYWGIVGFDFDIDGGSEEPEFVEVQGSGFLSCQ